jgi:hypothetical protein
MQALFFVSSGTRSRSADEKVAVMHQHTSLGLDACVLYDFLDRCDAISSHPVSFYTMA